MNFIESLLKFGGGQHEITQKNLGVASTKLWITPRCPPTQEKPPGQAGAEGGESSNAAVEDEVDVGVRQDWNDAARDAARGKKASMRNDHLAMILA